MIPDSSALDHSAAPVGVERLLRPQSVAIVGISANPGSTGMALLNNLELFQYQGQIHLVSRNHKEIHGKPCAGSIDELPKGIDVVVLCVPKTAVLESVQACARREAGAVMIFAAGFAEAGQEGKLLQQQINEMARQSGMLIAGPNCMGLTNFVDDVALTFAPGLKKTGVGEKGALSVLTQSGAMMSALRETAQARGVPVSYTISTGNEAMIGIEDYLAFLIHDDKTKVIAMYVEQIRRPKLFLQLAEKARLRNKTIVLLHPGRSEASREAAQSHTGSLVGDHSVIMTMLKHEHVLVVDTIEELVDTSWLLANYEQPPAKGAAILTESGALKGYAYDFCDSIGLDLPPLSPSTCEALENVLPEFTSATNPLDITAQALRDQSIYTKSAEALLKDPAVGSLMIALLPGSPKIGLAKWRAVLPAIKQSSKPIALVVMGEGSPLAEELVEEIKEHSVPFFRSPDRAMKALARITEHGRALQKSGIRIRQADLQAVLLPRKERILPEYLGKAYLSRIGIPVPQGELAKNEEEALAVAERIGYPVVIKIQAGGLAHKSDVGGVIVGINDGEQLKRAWARLHANVKWACPDVIPEGVLVEKMGGKGIEMVIGARRDPQWGPVLMVGFGGIWIEVWKDFRLMPPDLGEEAVMEEIYKLRSADLLRGARGSQPADVKALAKMVTLVGKLMLSTPELEEIDINPVMVYPEGQGVLALDALIVAR